MEKVDEGKTTAQATEEEVLVGDGALGSSSGGGGGITKLPEAEVEVMAEPVAVAVGIKRSSDAGGAVVSGTAKLDDAMTEPTKRRRKKKTVVRLGKEFIEFKMSRPPPTPYPRLSDKTIERMERRSGCPGEVRAMEDELTTKGQKDIDRHAEMLRQYELQEYADIELTDDEEDGREEWRTLGVVDG